MTDISNLEKRLGDLERRHDRTRQFLADFASITTALLMAAAFASGIYTFVLVVAICYGITRRLARWVLRDRNNQTRPLRVDTGQHPDRSALPT
jgi:hypothetical protein